MKLIDLFEEDEVTTSKATQAIADMIAKDCSVMVDAYRKEGAVLYRGSNKDSLFAKETIRQDRRPVEMDEDAHELIVKAMKKLDFPTRANSLFVSADYDTASHWGSMNIVFVPNGWTALVYDNLDGEYSFDELQDFASNIMNRPPGKDGDDVDMMADFIKALKPRKVNTAAGLVKVLAKNTNDILINAPNYYRLSMKGAHKQRAEDVLKLLGIKI